MPICAVTMAKEFGWSKSETGIVLGAFFWGYCFTQVLGGHASDRWVFWWRVQVLDQLWKVEDDDDNDDEHCFYRIGGERVLLLSTFSWGVMTAVTPLLANIGLRPLVTMTVTRFLLGVMQGESIIRDSWGVKGENCKKNERKLDRTFLYLKKGTEKCNKVPEKSIYMSELEISTSKLDAGGHCL